MDESESGQMVLEKVKWTFLAVQNSSIGDLVTHSLTHSLTEGTFTFDIKERPQRPVTFETFHQSDEETRAELFWIFF